MGAQVRVEVVSVGSVGSSVVSSYFPGSPVPGGPVWDGARWLAIAMTSTSTGKVVTSTDGIAWYQPVQDINGYAWSHLRYLNGEYVISAATLPGYSAAAVATSTDALNWTIATWSYGNWNWSWIVVGNGGFLLVEGVQGSGTYSSNGLRTYFWDGGSVDYVNNYGWLGTNVNTLKCQPAFNGHVFIAGGKVGTTPVLYTSTNGIGGWVSQTVPAGITDIYGFCAFNSSILMVGFDSGTNTGKTAISTDNGVSWSSWVNLPASIGNGGWAGASWSGSSFIIFEKNPGPSSYQWAISSDGLSWVAGDSSVGFPSNRPDGYLKGWNGSYWVSMGASTGASFVIYDHGSITSDLVSLSSVVSSECYRTGLLSPGDIDTSSLNSNVRGFLVSGSGSVRNSLEILQGAWPFDIRQHGYTIQFVNRGSSAVATIPLADLGAGTGEPVVMTTIQRTPDLSLPRRASVKYLDYDREYNTGEQYASRDTVQSYNTHSVDFPLVLTGTEAAGMAETLLYLYWMERYELEFSLPATYNNLEPGDVVNLTTPEGVVSVRLVGVNNTSTNIVECKGRFNSAAVYSPTAVAATPVTAGNTTITPLGGVKYELLDVPMVSSAQSSPSFLLAMTGLLDGWKGGTLMQSTDSGATWYSMQDVDPPGTAMGYCSNSIGVVDSRTVDSASVLSVTMTQGDLYSVTQAAMFGGQNYFAYGADGRWEIIAVQTCTLVSASNYNLTNMLRGRAGTEWAMGLHQAGDALVLLDTTDVSLINSTSDMIGVPSVYRGITFGRDISTDSNKNFTYRGVNLMPLSPINLTGSIDAGTGDWTLSFIPRTRDTSGWRDFVDSPMGETSESYQVDIFSDNTYSTVKRTLTSSAPSISYSSTNQIADFGSNQSTLYVKVYQMSSVVGRGYPLSSSITR